MCIYLHIYVIKAHTPDSQLAILYATSKMDIWILISKIVEYVQLYYFHMPAAAQHLYKTMHSFSYLFLAADMIYTFCTHTHRMLEMRFVCVVPELEENSVPMRFWSSWWSRTSKLLDRKWKIEKLIVNFRERIDRCLNCFMIIMTLLRI